MAAPDSTPQTEPPTGQAPHSSESRTALSLIVNDKPIQAFVPDRLLLSDFLRDDLGLTALKVACGEGACGACTIVIDGEPARSCTLLALQADGTRIVTLEGMNAPQGLNAVQKIFQRHHALQCGYCTPGWLMTVYSMIELAIPPDSDEVAQYLSGHLCRCTGYRNIWTAVRLALGALPDPKMGDPKVNHAPAHENATNIGAPTGDLPND